jgi:hypothetical protein
MPEIFGAAHPRNQSREATIRHRGLVDCSSRPCMLPDDSLSRVRPRENGTPSSYRESSRGQSAPRSGVVHCRRHDAAAHRAATGARGCSPGTEPRGGEPPRRFVQLPEASHVRTLAGFVLNISLAAALLTGCGGSQPPIGNRNEYDAFRGVCTRSEQDFMSPNGGIVAALRLVECSGAPIVPASRDYFIFVHKLNDIDANNEDTLVLGYREWQDFTSFRVEPTVAWVGDSLLQVRTGVPSLITTKRTDVNGIRVTYGSGGTDIGEEHGPMCAGTTEWCDE